MGKWCQKSNTIKNFDIDPLARLHTAQHFTFDVESKTDEMKIFMLTYHSVLHHHVVHNDHYHIYHDGCLEPYPELAQLQPYLRD